MRGGLTSNLRDLRMIHMSQMTWVPTPYAIRVFRHVPYDFLAWGADDLFGLGARCQMIFLD